MVKTTVMSEHPPTTPLSLATRGILYRIISNENNPDVLATASKHDIIMKASCGWICFSGKGVSYPHFVKADYDIMKNIEVEALPIGCKIVIEQDTVEP